MLSQETPGVSKAQEKQWKRLSEEVCYYRPLFISSGHNLIKVYERGWRSLFRKRVYIVCHWCKQKELMEK